MMAERDRSAVHVEPLRIRASGSDDTRLSNKSRCRRDLGADPQRLNVHGGAIALGHPWARGHQNSWHSVNALKTTASAGSANHVRGRRHRHVTSSSGWMALANTLHGLGIIQDIIGRRLAGMSVS